jgi:hypothetical protein
MTILRYAAASVVAASFLIIACGNSGDGGSALGAAGSAGSSGGAASGGAGNLAGAAGQGGTPIVAAPGKLALRVDLARQIPQDSLQILVTLGNGVGGKPVPLQAVFFRLKTDDGILHTPRSRMDTPNWVNGRDPASGQELSAGASYASWGLSFDTADAYKAKPVELIFTLPGAALGDAGVGDGRTASAPVTFEPCAKCPAKTTSGEGVCTYLSDDPEHCGACNVPVGNGSCRGGKPACTGALTACGSVDGSAYSCVDLQTSTQHCGACNRPVATGTNVRCIAGKDACSSDYTLCPSGCVNLKTDVKNCGACGVAIPTNGLCSEGKPSCYSPGTACGGKCVDLTDDLDNCGACGKVCNTFCYKGACE